MPLDMILLRSIKMFYLKNKKRIDKFIEKDYHFGVRILNEKHYQ